MTRAVNVASSTMPVGTTAQRPASPVAGMRRNLAWLAEGNTPEEA